MADGTEHNKSDLERIAEVLLTHGVEFIVIGGQAEVIHGSPRVTYDVDICYRRTSENLDRLARALHEMKPKLRDAPPDLPFTIDARALALGSNFTLRTRIGDLDLLAYLEPIGGFDELVSQAERIQLGHSAVLVISLDDLIRIKSHLQRPKDQEALRQLRSIKRLRDRIDKE